MFSPHFLRLKLHHGLHIHAAAKTTNLPFAICYVLLKALFTFVYQETLSLVANQLIDRSIFCVDRLVPCLPRTLT